MKFFILFIFVFVFISPRSIFVVCRCWNGTENFFILLSFWSCDAENFIYELFASFFIFSLISFIVSLQWHKVNKISWLHFVKQVTHRKFNSMKPVCQKYTMNSDDEKNKNTFGNFVNCVLTALRQPQLRSMKQFWHCWNWL